MGSQAVKDKSAEVINLLTLKLDLKLEADHPYDYLVWVLKAAPEVEPSHKPELAEQLLLRGFRLWVGGFNACEILYWQRSRNAPWISAATKKVVEENEDTGRLRSHQRFRPTRRYNGN